MRQVPNRPQGHRPDPVTGIGAGRNATQFSEHLGGMVTTGYGFFPSLFALQFQTFAPASRNPDSSASEEEIHTKYLSRYLKVLFVAVAISLLVF